MTEITSIAGKKAEHDYASNFMPRKEIDLRLTFEEIKEILQDKGLLINVQGIAWHFKFYLKQLFLLSIKNIRYSEKIDDKKKLEMMNELQDIVQYDSFNVARAFVAMMRLVYFKDSITTYQLHDIFSGHTIYDDFCAQVAYEEWNKRGRGD